MNFLLQNWMKWSPNTFEYFRWKIFIDFLDKLKFFWVRTIFRVLFCQNSKRKEKESHQAH